MQTATVDTQQGGLNMPDATPSRVNAQSTTILTEYNQSDHGAACGCCGPQAGLNQETTVIGGAGALDDFSPGGASTTNPIVVVGQASSVLDSNNKSDHGAACGCCGPQAGLNQETTVIGGAGALDDFSPGSASTANPIVVVGEATNVLTEYNQSTCGAGCGCCGPQVVTVQPDINLTGANVIEANQHIEPNSVNISMEQRDSIVPSSSDVHVINNEIQVNPKVDDKTLHELVKAANSEPEVFDSQIRSSEENQRVELERADSWKAAMEHHHTELERADSWKIAKEHHRAELERADSWKVTKENHRAELERADSWKAAMEHHHTELERADSWKVAKEKHRVELERSDTWTTSREESPRVELSDPKDTWTTSREEPPRVELSDPKDTWTTSREESPRVEPSDPKDTWTTSREESPRVEPEPINIKREESVVASDVDLTVKTGEVQVDPKVDKKTLHEPERADNSRPEEFDSKIKAREEKNSTETKRVSVEREESIVVPDVDLKVRADKVQAKPKVDNRTLHEPERADNSRPEEFDSKIKVREEKNSTETKRVSVEREESIVVPDVDLKVRADKVQAKPKVDNRTLHEPERADNSKSEEFDSKIKVRKEKNSTELKRVSMEQEDLKQKMKGLHNQSLEIDSKNFHEDRTKGNKISFINEKNKWLVSYLSEGIADLRKKIINKNIKNFKDIKVLIRKIISNLLFLLNKKSIDDLYVILIQLDNLVNKRKKKIYKGKREEVAEGKRYKTEIEFVEDILESLIESQISDLYKFFEAQKKDSDDSTEESEVTSQEIFVSADNEGPKWQLDIFQALQIDNVDEEDDKYVK